MIKCIKCGYEWNYKGKSKYHATCSMCDFKFRLTERVLDWTVYVHAIEKKIILYVVHVYAIMKNFLPNQIRSCYLDFMLKL